MHNKEDNILWKKRMENINFDLITEIFKVLSDQTKLKIIIALLEEKHCVHDLCDIVDSTQSNISHALSKMKAMHIVKEEKIGKHVFYEVYDEHVLNLISIVLKHMEDCYEKGI